MPASSEVFYTRYEKIRIDVDPLHEPDRVYFTDEAPEFELVLMNETDQHVTSYEDEGIYWALALGTGIPEAYKWESEEVEIEPHGEQRITIGGELLAHEGNASIAINRNIGLRGGKDHDPLTLDPTPYNKDNLLNLYTFTIWDRSHYEAVHEQPKRLQKWVVRLSILVALLATIQIVIGLFQIGLLSLS